VPIIPACRWPGTVQKYVYVPGFRLSVSDFVPFMNVGVVPRVGPLVPDCTATLCGTGDLLVNAIVTLPALAVRVALSYISPPLGLTPSCSAVVDVVVVVAGGGVVAVGDVVADGDGLELLLLEWELPQPASASSATASASDVVLLDTGNASCDIELGLGGVGNRSRRVPSALQHTEDYARMLNSDSRSAARTNYRAPVAAEDHLGSRFRALRTSRGLSLTEVAEATDISSSFLSLFETGKNDITVGRLLRLVRFFGVSITELIPDPEPQETLIVRRDGRRQLESRAEGMVIELLTHRTRPKMLPTLVSLEPGVQLSDEGNPDRSDLFLFLLEGEITVADGEHELARLQPGDAAYMLLDRRWTFRNVGRTRAQWLGVTTPGAI
jgi:transcriptional regulator with XRE-family HTH domain